MGRATSWKRSHIYTVGHSTRSVDELVDVLRAFEVSTLVDIRTIARSRHNPQFNEDALRSALRKRNVRYLRLTELGGLRRPRVGSVNTGWRNTSFRGFADHMATEEFADGLDKLREATATGHAALMCAEAVPWRCHRSLVADALTARGANVTHILGATKANPHRITSFAKVDGARVTYPSGVGWPETKPPFHLEATVRVLQRRPTNRIDVWNEGKYVRLFPTGEGDTLVEVSNHGTIDRPDVRVRVVRGEPSAETYATLEPRVRRLLGLDVKPDSLARIAEVEPRIAPTALALRGMRPPRFAELFETFLQVIPFQQVSLDAGVAVVARLAERYGTSLAHDGHTFYTCPTAERIAQARVDGLRRAGLSLRKAQALRGAAQAVASGRLTEEQLVGMRSEDAIRSLRELDGIGPWSATLVLLRGLGRLDVFPPGDVGVARELSLQMALRSGQSVDAAVERFGKRRGYLYFCSLGAALLARGLIHAAPPRRTSRAMVRRVK